MSHLKPMKPAKIAPFTFYDYKFTASKWILDEFTREFTCTVKMGSRAFCTVSTDPNEGFCAVSSCVEAFAYALTEPKKAIISLSKRLV